MSDWNFFYVGEELRKRIYKLPTTKVFTTHTSNMGSRTCKELIAQEKKWTHKKVQWTEDWSSYITKDDTWWQAHEKTPHTASQHGDSGKGTAKPTVLLRGYLYSCSSWLTADRGRSLGCGGWSWGTRYQSIQTNSYQPYKVTHCCEETIPGHLPRKTKTYFHINCLT